MDANERQSALVGVLRREGRIEVAEAASRFAIAEMTIRRDLEVLVRRGVARRVRGGAINLLMRGEELPFGMRELDAVDEKRRIGAKVAEMLGEGESVLLDGGTTAVHIAQAIGQRRLTVMPMSMHAATVLAANDSIRLFLPGGRVRPGELAMVGPVTVGTIASVRFDTAVLACCGLSEGQVTAHDFEDAAVKQAMIAAASRVVLVADSSKFGRSAMAVVCGADELDSVVTDTAAPHAALEALRSVGIDVLCV